MLAATAVTLILVALLVFTAARKLSHRAGVVATYHRVGVPERRLNALAVLLLAAAAGLVVGFWWPPLALAAAIGLVAYFLLAVAAHIRARDVRQLPTPLLYLALAIAVVALHVAT